jgi:hypothetical protein
VFLLDLFRSFLPLHNPIGFGAADFIEFALASIFVALILLRRRILSLSYALATRTRWCILLLAILPIVLRLALLPHYPVPAPAGSDDFSYLLLADTLSHFHLANPVHPMHQFFETIFVLQEPSYSSIFPLGQGIVLALGWMIFGHPWAGILLSSGAMCALCFWMLQAWTTPVWALLGGLLAVAEFGPLCQWTNDYWGGSVSACAGCLLFGALPRLRERARLRDGALLGLGIAIQWLTRPFECVLVVLAVSLFFIAGGVRKLGRHEFAAALAAVVVTLPALAMTLLQNKQVTGNWTTLPYALSRYQYGVPTTFTLQPNPVPHRPLTPEQQLDYEAQCAVHGPGTDTLAAFWQRFASRAGFYRFFVLVPLYLVIPAFLSRLLRFRFTWLLATLLILSLGANFYPYFYPHYIAAATCLFILAGVVGLEHLSQWRVRGLPAGHHLAGLIVLLCAAHFVFWYGLHLTGGENIRVALMRYENWDFINYGDPEGRIAINDRLARVPGPQLVFVRYWPQHMFHGWIHNAADIDRARVVWAADLGEEENRALLRYYPGRTPWLLEPDARPPRLISYR